MNLTLKTIIFWLVLIFGLHGLFISSIRIERSNDSGFISRFEDYSNRMVRGIRYHDDWKLKWVRRDDAAVRGLKEEYLNWLNAVRSEINPEGKEIIVYYPGIGPWGGNIDIISPLLATNFTKLYAVDKVDIDYGLFKRLIGRSLSSPIAAGVIKNLEFFQEEGENIFGFSFDYMGVERIVKIYYQKNANQFFPPELERGYDVLYTRWSGGILLFGEEIKRKIIDNLNSQTGYLITDNVCLFYKDEFLDNFSEIQFPNIDTELIWRVMKFTYLK